MYYFSDLLIEQIYEDALAEVNRLRKERNIGEPLTDLPKGIRGESTSCPIQKALQCYAVGDLFIEWQSDGLGETDTPEAICEFILAFDDHEFPELEE